MSSKRMCAYRCSLTAAVVLALAAGLRADAQQPIRIRGGQRRAVAVGQSASPLAIAHATFERATGIMESALPIYDGHRHRAIELSKLAAREIKAAATGKSVGANANSVLHKTVAQRAALIPKRAEAGAFRYSAAQISASNSRMQQGIQLLQQGLQQVQAIGNDPANHMSDAAEFGSMAVQAANKGLQFAAVR